MEATRTLSRNEKLQVLRAEIDRLDGVIATCRNEARVRLTENAEIDYLAGLRGTRSPQERERFAENKKVIDKCEKTIAEAAKVIEKLHDHTEKELKTTFRSWY